MLALFGIDILGQILCILQALAAMVLWALISAINLIIEALGSIIGWAISQLPDMPDDVEWDGVASDVFGYANWVFPVGYIITALALLLTLWIAWAVVAILLRWAKAV